MRKLIIVLVCIIVIFSLFGCESLSNFIDNYDINSWTEVEIPTDTVLKARVKLPKDWIFAQDNEKLYIKDTNNNVIATELYCEWHKDFYIGYNHYVEDLHFNEELSEDLRNLENYDVCIGGSAGAHAYKIVINDTERYAIRFGIMDSLQISGGYELMMVFEEGFNDEKILSKMVHSYEYGGYYDY